MTKGTNPFEGSFNNDNRNTDQPVTTTSTNPFEDDDMMNNISGGGVPSGSSDRNPFDDHVDDNYDEGEDDTFETTTDENVIGAPVEASWQYLGDLPYRRIPVYSNVRWGGNSNERNNQNDSNGRSRMTSEILNYGLSAFPKAALQRQPDLSHSRVEPCVCDC